MSGSEADRAAASLRFRGVTASDTRTPGDDESGRWLREAIESAGHRMESWRIAREERATLRRALEEALDADVVVVTGGTGIGPRDLTPEILGELCDRMIPGFGEIFRALSYEEIGSRALSSRACAGVCGETVLFALPGSTAACRLGWEKLIRPEVLHLRDMRRGAGHGS